MALWNPFYKDVSRRDEILFGGFQEEKYCGGIRRFEGLSASKLRQLVEEGFADPEDKQNYAPTLMEFLRFAEEHTHVTFSGYAVHPEREDYRVSVDGMEMITMDVREASDAINFLRGADEFDSEFQPDGLTATISAWWD